MNSRKNTNVWVTWKWKMIPSIKILILSRSKSSTKVIMVFNTTAKSKDQLSLNNMNGPQLQPDILTILVNFRKHNVAFTANVKMMYRQIQICEQDSRFQKILWRYSENNPSCEAVWTYNFNLWNDTCFFHSDKMLGLISSQSSDQVLEVTNIISHCFYIDDLMAHFSTCIAVHFTARSFLWILVVCTENYIDFIININQQNS